jgi:hypothetical protein
MRNWFLVASLVVVCQCVSAQGNTFDKFFVGTTMRVDYVHAGTGSSESISLDQIYEEGEWPGSRVNLIDVLNLGEYLVSVVDIRTNALIYSRGFSSMFNEWQTTAEAATGLSRSFSETVRFPFPRRAVQLVVSRRDKRMVFHEIYSVVIDPQEEGSVVRNLRRPAFPVEAVMKNGPPSEKVDILIIGDGYSKAETGKFRGDARHLNDVMFATKPFSDRKKDFNVWTIAVESGETGIDIPDKGIWKDNALGCRYSTFGLPRYVLTTENRALRDIAGAAPYDFICILVNDSRYGGGGIYNLYATTYTGEKLASQAWQSDYMYVHEFGHSFGGLADEYYTSTVATLDFYPVGVEPWEPNITRTTDRSKIKWSALLTPGIALPTRWEKSSYDSVAAIQSKLDRLAPDYYEKREPIMKRYAEILKDPEVAGKVGAFEGAGYMSTGVYRPAIDCRMFSLSLVDFDPVCAAAINRVIDFYSH